jgi:hypothetical protein
MFQLPLNKSPTFSQLLSCNTILDPITPACAAVRYKWLELAASTCKRARFPRCLSKHPIFCKLPAFAQCMMHDN